VTVCKLPGALKRAYDAFDNDPVEASGYTTAVITQAIIAKKVGDVILEAPPVASSGQVATQASTTGTSLVRGVVVELRLSRASFTAAEQAAIEFKYAVANGRIAAGAETSLVGSQVPYNYYLSQRFVRDTLQPGAAVKKVRVPSGFQVDEFVSRQYGGRQVPQNQWLMPNEDFLNNRLGPLEQRATANLSKGTPVRGWQITWED
jgi:hypothetical protein